MDNLLFAILPANSSLETPLSLIVTAPEVTVKLSVENEAIPLFEDVASSEEMVTVPLDSAIKFLTKVVELGLNKYNYPLAH